MSHGVPRQHYSTAERASTHEGVEHWVEENTVARLSFFLLTFFLPFNRSSTLDLMHNITTRLDTEEGGAPNVIK